MRSTDQPDRSPGVPPRALSLLEVIVVLVVVAVTATVAVPRWAAARDRARDEAELSTATAAVRELEALVTLGDNPGVLGGVGGGVGGHHR